MQNKYENKSNNLFLNDTFNSILALITHHMSLKKCQQSRKIQGCLHFFLALLQGQCWARVQAMGLVQWSFIENVKVDASKQWHF